MATQSQKVLIKAVKAAKLENPWKLLDRAIAYDANKHLYSLRSGTIPTTVRLYQPILDAAAMYVGGKEYNEARNYAYHLVEIRGFNSYATCMEMKMPDDTSFVVHATKDSLNISVIEADGTKTPALAYTDMSSQALAAIMAALFPFVLDIDESSGGSKLASAIVDFGQKLEESVQNPWNDKNDIPELAKDTAYFMDCVISILSEKMDCDCGSTSGVAAEVVFPGNGTVFKGATLAESYPGGWTPVATVSTGTPVKRNAKFTVADAKAVYGGLYAHRNWTDEEKKLIPKLPDDMPVMAETMRMVKRIADTKGDINPCCNLMWRGITSYGKSTGVKQLACILNVPLLILTCHPNMEAQDFISSMIPKAEMNDIPLDTGRLIRSGVGAVKSAAMTASPLTEAALTHYQSLSADKQEELCCIQDFMTLAIMDTEAAEQMLFGKSESLTLDELLCAYNNFTVELAARPMREKLTELEAVNAKLQSEGGKEDSKNGGIEFTHVVSPYLKAIANGYIVEIQEASRIRDSGVMVSINEFDRPNALIPLMNGYSTTRHPDAIVVITDNVGYASCRPIDPSVLRRQSMIIDSYEHTKEDLLDRVKRNTGVTDMAMLDRAYKMWECVKNFCEQNSITEGTVSATELERFVQAVKYDGPDSEAVNLDDCIISKATSSIEDQRDIRSAVWAVAAGF